MTRWPLRDIIVISLILGIWVCIIFAGCATRPPAAESPVSGLYRNACLPEAAMMAQGLREKGIPAKVLAIKTPQWGHALCIYTYPPGKNQLWAWDQNWKSLRLRAFFSDAPGIARAWLIATNRGSTSITSAEFLE